MERARVTWTDERLEDLARRMDEGFKRVDADLRELRGEMNARFAEINGRFGENNGRFDALQRLTLLIGAGMIGTMIVGFASVLAAQLA